MTKEEYIKLAESKWPELELLKATGDLYAYEKRFSEIWTKLGRSVLEGNISEVPSRIAAKKKIETRCGQIEIAKTSSFSKSVQGFSISPLVQKMMVYVITKPILTVGS